MHIIYLIVNIIYIVYYYILFLIYELKSELDIFIEINHPQRFYFISIKY